MRNYLAFFEFYYYVIKRSPKRYNVSANGQLNQLTILMTPMVLWLASMVLFLIFGPGWAMGVFIGLGALMVINFMYSTTVYREAITIELNIAKERRRLAEEEHERKMKEEEEERRRKHHEEMKAWEEKLKRDAEDLKRQKQQQQHRSSGASGRASYYAGGSGGSSGKSREQMEAEERLRKFAEQFNSEDFFRAQEEARRRAEQQRRNDAQYSRIATHYAILGIEPTKDLDVIKKAYRKKAKQYHPDTGGDAEMFKKITTANEEILKFVKSI